MVHERKEIMKETINKVVVYYEGQREAFVPELVEKCMEPGSYNTYKVTIKETEEYIELTSLRKSKRYPVGTTYTEEEFTMEKPGKSRCTGDCQSCQKCS